MKVDGSMAVMIGALVSLAIMFIIFKLESGI